MREEYVATKGGEPTGIRYQQGFTGTQAQTELVSTYLF